jgi:pSer/pThr/pTyr-binding forkhead associated (FHA) protein
MAGNAAPSHSAASRKDFDPNATRVFVQTATRAPTQLRKSTGGTPVATTSLRQICLSGPQKGKSIHIAGSGLIIGRSSSSDIVVGDSCVSSRHAWIGVVNGRAVLRDLKSTNGTFLNAKMNAPIQESELSSGDTIFFGGHQANQWRFMAE